jgi:hypothetical protein
MNTTAPNLNAALAELDRARELLALLLNLDNASELSEEDTVLHTLRDHINAARALLAETTGQPE